MLEDVSRDRVRGVATRDDADEDDNITGLVPTLLPRLRQLFDADHALALLRA